jgi:hypothetical protein
MSTPTPNVIDLDFEGFFLCRLATDPDPSLEERGISGFTYAVAGESLLNPAIFCQPEDVKAVYGMKSKDYLDREEGTLDQFDIVNIRQASPDYARYNAEGIGIKVTGARLNGDADASLLASLGGGKVRFASEGFPGWKFPGPIFEGRNQIVSDGDPDRFSVNPFIFRISDAKGDSTLLQRFDPMDPKHPYDGLWQIDDGDTLARRLPVQRFPGSSILLESLGITDPIAHFVNRQNWLDAKILEADACGKVALAEAYRSRRYAVNFFTQATGPTVLSNRLASRIPLRQLYIHEVAGTPAMDAIPIVVDQQAFQSKALGHPITVRTDVPWEIQYYIGGFDGDLMTGLITGTITLPYEPVTA